MMKADLWESLVVHHAGRLQWVRLLLKCFSRFDHVSTLRCKDKTGQQTGSSAAGTTEMNYTKRMCVCACCVCEGLGA